MRALALVGLLRDALRRCANAIERRLQQPEPVRLADPEETERLAREQRRRELRAGRVPWYSRRPGELKVPDGLKYFEAVHGTRATVEMLKRVGRKLDEGSDE